MDEPNQSALRARQRELVTRVSTLKEQLHAATCELIQVDAQLGDMRDLHPASSGRSDV